MRCVVFGVLKYLVWIQVCVHYVVCERACVYVCPDEVVPVPLLNNMVWLQSLYVPDHVHSRHMLMLMS